MILFFGEGRLGNQLFQYAFIRSIGDKRHVVVSCNFEDIKNLFQCVPGIININNRILKLAIRKILLPIFNVLSRARLITSIKIDTCNENGNDIDDVTYTKTNGLIPLTFIYSCYAQSEKFFNHDAVKDLVIKREYIDTADNYLNKIPCNYNKVFVHVRRGDYIVFTILGDIEVTLPASYYKNRIMWFEENIDNPYYIFLTDDYQYVESEFRDIKNKVISDNSMFVDFAIITLCEYGIMSNSSFSWWSAYMMKSRKKVFSPKYWLGWRCGIEFQKGSTPSFSEVVEVSI